MVRVSRVVHGVISVFFSACLALIWIGAVRGRADDWTLAAIAALVAEGALVLAAGGNCPAGPLWRRLGDETPFFELFLPPRAAKRAFPVLGTIAVVGALVLAVRTL
ncbi:MAG TPA: hypothetical protein VE261_03060 [Gaiellaceae bacterium]|nr:hypothetical protein [Gaiellaceae bacterium]